MEAGEKYALVGPSSQMCHELFSYMLGLLDDESVEQGYVEIDGYRIK